MSTLATRTNALRPTKAEIGDVDAILARYAELEARKRASYANNDVARKSRPMPKPVVKPVVSVPPRVAHILDARCYSLPIQGPCQPGHVFYKFYMGEAFAGNVINPINRVLISDCLKYIAVTEGVSVSALEGRGRAYTITWPRHKAIYLARKFTFRSLPEIGHRIGGRDHTSILSSCRRAQCIVDRGLWTPPTARQLLRTVRPEALIEEAGE